MKTFQEWIEEYRNDQTSDEPRKLSFRNGDLIKAIQLDAYEKGIRDAAEKHVAVVESLQNFVNSIEGYDTTGVWPDNPTLRNLGDEGRSALNQLEALLTKPKDKE